jgi:glycosyltransferase involved in cell wall biosynthesis
MHDYGWRRGRRVKAVYLWLEKRICSNADVFLFLVEAARHNMAARSGMPGCGRVIYPGANPEMFQDGLYEKRDQCHFAHFGTLDGTRNLVVFLKALRLLIDNNRVDKDIVRVDVYGSLDGGSRKAIKELGLEEMVTNHGMVLRKEALVAMQKADCLLLIQNTIFFSSETIPSKVYEYLLCGRPVLGFVHHNPELDSMLQESRNFSVPADQVEPAADAIEKIVAQFKDSSLSQWTPCSIWTVEKAVDKLIHFGNEATRRIK